MSVPLDQQTTIVTGAAQGLGAAIAKAFADAGARVILMDYNADAVSQTAAICGDRAVAMTVDLSDAAATEAAVNEALAEFGPCHTLVHNAAILQRTQFADESFATFFRTFNVGLQAGFQLAHAVWPGMVQQGGGAVIFVSSRSGIEGFAEEAAYCAAKHALEGLSKCLAMEGAPHGILSHTVTPGMYMHTPMSERNYSPELQSKWVDPALLAPAFVALAERRDTALSGQRISAWELSQAVA